MPSIPYVFLSLAGVDEQFVERVRDDLPEGLAAFYTRSFENGENLIAAMEERVGQATVFALFASRASLDSCWVQFEIDRARLAKIQRSNFRLLVFIIDKNVSHTELPGWMKEHWVSRAGQGARDIARYIRNVLYSPALSGSPTGRGFGRGGLIDAANRQVRESTLKSGQTPNVYSFCGNTGVGRRTVSRNVLEHVFATKPEITFGPEFSLPRFSDLADIYRALRQEIETGFSVSAFQSELESFNSGGLGAQIEEIIRNLGHFSSLGQSVTVITGNGLFDAFGDLKEWAAALFSALRQRPDIIVSFVLNRQIHAKALHKHPNLLQFVVPALPDEEIRAIMIATAPVFGAAPTPPSDDVVRRIGGHPGLAKAATRLIAQKGLYVFENSPRDFFDIQDDVFQETIESTPIESLVGEILCILSWVPQISPDILRNIIGPRHNLTEEQLALSLEQLILGCLVFLSGPNYAISDPIRMAFRRSYGLGSRDLREALSAALKEAWARAEAKDTYRTEIFDAMVYMVGLEGGQLPVEFKKLILPSTLQDVLKSTYDLGHEDPDALRRVASWSILALQLNMDELTREEILAIGVRAFIRLEQYDDAEKLIKEIESRSYPSTNFLKGLQLRRQGHIQDAIAQFLEARRYKVYSRQVIQELALCYRQAAMWSELSKLLQDEDKEVKRTSFLLDIRIGQLIGAGKYEEAEDEIKRLELLRDEDCRAVSRRAHILIKRDHKYEEAIDLLTRALERSNGGHVPIRRLRAIAAARHGNMRLAKEDLGFIQSRAGRGVDALGVEIHIALESRDIEAAERAWSKIPNKDAHARILEARIMEAKADHPGTSYSECARLRQGATELRARYTAADEFLNDT